MQRTEPTSESRSERQFLTPLRAFTVGITLIGLFLGLWLVGQSGNPEEPPNTPITAEAEPDVPTDAEAIRIFRQLDRQRLAAYRALDPTLIDVAFTDDGPLENQVRDEIEQLSRDGVSAVPRIHTKDIDVVSVSSREMQLRQKAVFDLRFENERGMDVTASGRPENQVILWTLRKPFDEWLLHSASIEHAAPIRS